MMLNPVLLCQNLFHSTLSQFTHTGQQLSSKHGNDATCNDLSLHALSTCILFTGTFTRESSCGV